MNVTTSGPLFSSLAYRAIESAVEDMARDLAAAGVDAVKAQLRPSHGVDTGSFEASLTYRQRGNEARVYSPQAAKAAWLEGVSERNKRSSYKGIQPFAKATRQTEAQALQTVSRRATELVRDLRGGSL